MQIRFLGSTTNSSSIKDARGGVRALTFLFPLLFTCHLDKPCTIERLHHITCAVFVRVALTALMTHSCQHACDNLGHCKWAAFSDTAPPSKRIGKKKAQRWPFITTQEGLVRYFFFFCYEKKNRWRLQALRFCLNCGKWSSWNKTNMSHIQNPDTDH